MVKELSTGDIIEIVQHDEECRMKLRRVRVRSLQRVGDKYVIVGENLYGETPIAYTLDETPWTRIIEEPGNIGWYYFGEDPQWN